MEPTETPTADQGKMPAVSPAELARSIQLFKWGLHELQNVSQRLDVVEKNVRQLARDGVHRDAVERLENDVKKLRDDVRRLQLAGKKILVTGAKKVGDAKSETI